MQDGMEVESAVYHARLAREKRDSHCNSARARTVYADMNRMLFVLAALILPHLVLPPPCQAQALPPEREVSGHRLISRSDPALTIQLPRAARYLGADRWHMNDIADAEIHVFVEADRNNNLRTLYWIQFEAYLPTNTHKFNYSKDEPVTFGGLPFYRRARFGTDERQKPSTDAEHVRTIVERAGYKMPANTMNVRLVHLPDESRRKELMLYYIEDMAPTGYTTAQLIDGNKTRPEWEPIKKSLIERAARRIKIKR